MSETKWTAGEWQKGVAGNCNVVSFDGFDIVGVAQCYEHNRDLISSAPDLYAACEAAYKKLTDIHDGGYGQHLDNPLPTMLRNALQKARGQS